LQARIVLPLHRNFCWTFIGKLNHFNPGYLTWRNHWASVVLYPNLYFYTVVATYDDQTSLLINSTTRITAKMNLQSLLFSC